MLRKYCEIEICPWHVPSNLRRAKFKQNGKKKVHRNKTESTLLEKCNQNEESAKNIPSENEPNIPGLQTPPQRKVQRKPGPGRPKTK